MPRINDALVERTLRANCKPTNFCLVFDTINLRNQLTTYAGNYTFDDLSELPEELHDLIRMLDAAADENGKADLPNIGARTCCIGKFENRELQLPGTYYYVISPEAIKSGNGATYYVTLD